MSTPLPPMDARPLAQTASCKICTIRLETLCYQRAWWFRVFREILASGIRVFAIAYLIRPKDYLARSPMCFKCIRFRKNALKERSTLFNWLELISEPDVQPRAQLIADAKRTRRRQGDRAPRRGSRFYRLRTMNIDNRTWNAFHTASRCSDDGACLAVYLSSTGRAA